MEEKIALETIGPRAREAARQLREIAAFLSMLDTLDTEDTPGWEYMGTRFFLEEWGSLLDVADVLEGELAPEAEEYVRVRRSNPRIF